VAQGHIQRMNFPVAILMLSGTLLAATAAAQRIENPKALRLQGEQVSQVRLLRGDPAEKHYPAAAKKAALDGVVVVDVMLNEAGQVLEAQIVSESPKGAGFGVAALDAAKTFEFDNPLRRWVLISLTIEFLP
jgi:TonB family protein